MNYSDYQLTVVIYTTSQNFRSVKEIITRHILSGKKIP
jgi:hypothetical protein